MRDKKLCCGGAFPSPGGCLRANVNDGTYVRCRSEVPVICVIRIRMSGYIVPTSCNDEILFQDGGICKNIFFNFNI